MSFGSPIDVNAADPAQATSGKPPRQDDLNILVRKLEKRVKDLEDALTQITRQGGGLSLAKGAGISFTSPNGLVVKTLGVDNSGTQTWT